MCTSWSALHQSLICHLNRAASHQQYQAMRRQFEGLAPFPSIPALMEHQNGRQGAADARYHVIRVLVEAAQAEAAFRPVAQMMVVVALWPGLDAVRFRLSRGFPTARNALPGEIMSRISESVAALHLSKVTAVAATLIRNVERDIRRELIADQIKARITACIHAPEVEAAATLSALASAAQSPDLAEWLALLSPADAALLDRVFRLGETQEQAGLVMGLSHDAARKRVQRALRSLRSVAEK